MPVQHVDQIELNRLRKKKPVGYYLEDRDETHMAGRYGDYTDGQTRYHLIEDGKCILADCDM